MKNHFSEIKFYETYYFAHAVRNILCNQFAYLRGLDDFYGNDKFLSFTRPFSKYSAFHSFIEFIVDQNIHDENYDIDLKKRQDDVLRFKDILAFDWNPKSLPINEALDFYNIKHISFEDWLKNEGKESFQKANEDDIYDYIAELNLTGEYEALIEKIVGEVFFILFQNRRLLLNFNDMMARQVNRSQIDEIDEEYLGLFSKSGVLKRVSIPQWVKRAVYFRDRGICVICHKDLTGTVNISSSKHFDHMVPLAQGGLNDVTNIQLLCEQCNLEKLHYSVETSGHYELWYKLK